MDKYTLFKVVDNRDKIKNFLNKFNLNNYEGYLWYRNKLYDYNVNYDIPENLQSYVTLDKMLFNNILNNYDELLSYDKILWSRIYFSLPTYINDKQIYLIDIDLYRFSDGLYEKILNAIHEDELLEIFDTPFGYHLIVNNINNDLKKIIIDSKEQITISAKRAWIVLCSKDVRSIKNPLHEIIERKYFHKNNDKKYSLQYINDPSICNDILTFDNSKRFLDISEDQVKLR